ncbi:hypothetical protein FACS1894198_6890 [Clostridia bacterium]|nr:hypothetical protein FACS1894198_6890 [Clostridia bacterium]
MIKRMETPRASFISIVGEPNVGKSSLLNALVGKKVAIVTPKAQTTRTRITGLAETVPAELTDGLEKVKQEIMAGTIIVPATDEELGLFLESLKNTEETSKK